MVWQLQRNSSTEENMAISTTEDQDVKFHSDVMLHKIICGVNCDHDVIVAFEICQLDEKKGALWIQSLCVILCDYL